MALEEISFYNVNGEEISLSNLVSQIINFYDLKLEVGETKLTDFNEGSEIRNIIEAIAILEYARLEEQVESAQIAFISTSYGGWLDKIGELPFIGLPRIEGAYAQGIVTFTLATAQSDDFTIPGDTIVACSETGLEFVTLGDTIISAGETSADASVECLTMGEDGNVPALSIDTVSEEFVDIELVSVSNTSALEEGSDFEEDDDYRERLLENVRADGFGTRGWYGSLCDSVDGVHDVLLVDAVGYAGKMLVNGDVKPTPDSVLLEVLARLSDLDNLVLKHSFTVDKPAYTTVNLSVSLNVTNTISTDDLTANLKAFFDGGSSVTQAEFEGLNINDSVSRDDIVDVFSIFDDVVSVTSIQSNSSEVTTLTPATNGVLKLGTISYTQTEV